jgi:alkanesulfonate monooxygenase SsuD/methylene tetrahydromethanopterin reductase-like flavin-dependent oxidoreductase (luciferase family)
MELGIYTFGELTPDAATGRTLTPAERVRDLLEEVELADQLGLDVFGVGEHHRPDFVVSSPAVVLAAAAEHTKNIRLTSAVSIISTDDPVRVFQDFATLDLISGGRAEIMAGRGSFIESFPLFGYDLADYDELFAEKLELLLELRKSEHVTWSGKHRPPIDGLGVYPRPLQDPLPLARRRAAAVDVAHHLRIAVELNKVLDVVRRELPERQPLGLEDSLRVLHRRGRVSRTTPVRVADQETYRREEPCSTT